MSALMWFIAGAICATAAIFFVLAILSDDDPPAEEIDAYDEGDGMDGEDYLIGDRRWDDR